MTGLFATLRYATHDDILDRCTIDARPLKNGVESNGAQVRWVNAGQTALAATAGRSNCINNIGFRHAYSPLIIAWSSAEQRVVKNSGQAPEGGPELKVGQQSTELRGTLVCDEPGWTRQQRK